MMNLDGSTIMAERKGHAEPSEAVRPLHGLCVDHREMMIHDDVIMRTIVDIPEAQLRSLDRLTRQLGISRADAIRRAVEAYTRSNRVSDQHAFGIWRDREVDGLSYEDRVRGEWDRG